MPNRPPSTDVAVAQASAFPVFPLSKSRSTTPTPLSDPHTFPHEERSNALQNQEFNVRPPISQSKSSDAGSMLKRMNSITPGPFNIKGGIGEDQRVSAHKKSPSMGSSKDFSRPLSSGTVKSHTQKPSGSSSVYTRTRSTSTVSGVSRYEWDTSDVPSVPSIPKEQSILPPNDQVVKDSVQNTAQSSNFDFGPLTQADKSHTFPQDDSTSKEENKTQRRPSDPSIHSHKPRPSVTAAMQPLYSIGSSSSFKPSRSIKNRKASAGINRITTGPGGDTDGQGERNSQDAPPVPAPIVRAPRDLGSPSHTPHESTSSNGSYRSDVRSGSSRSSPPLAESPKRRLQEVSEHPPSKNTFNDFQFGVDNRSPLESPVLPPPHVFSPFEPEVYIPSGPSAPPSQAARPLTTGEAQAPPPPTRRPTIPDIEPYLPTLSPVVSPDDYLVSSFDSQTHSQPHSHNFRLSPAPPRARKPVSSGSAPHRSRPPDKGPCRGCGELIIGKSVSSADGRLSGRYHKGCFVCKTCNNVFQTADFYVIQNHPYCGRHYHELNNSLCQGCDRGIEGQYLETQTRRKFHSYCFTCQDCHKILREDYFEWNGRTLCEQHAFKAAQQPSSALGIGGGRRYPERRTTKLMTMM